MKNINLISPINPLGYGTVGYNLLRALSKKYEVALFPIGDSQFPGGNELLIKNAVSKAAFYNPDAPCLRVWHQFDLAQFVGRRKRIGFPIFELNRFTAQEIHQLKSLDHIVVCSKWAEKVVRDNGIEVPVTVVPLGVDTSIFKPRQDYREQRPPWLKDTTVFLNIGKWEVRKGHDQLLEAFNAAFEPGDNVELWMINENPFIGYENTLWKKKYADSKMGAHISFHPRYESHEHLVRLYNQADCFVTCAKAEGYNLEALEAMACGAHVIGTNYSGHTEFMNENNTLLVNPVGMELANDGKWFNGQGEWAVFSAEEIVDQMRFVHDMLRGECRLGRNLNGIETAQKFTWDASVVELEKAL